MAIAGSCLCGRVRFEIDGRVSPIGLCHCSLCRKETGTGAAAQLVTSRKSLRFTAGQNLLGEFHKPSGFGTRFCRQCGCPMPKLHPSGKVYWVPAGSLDDDPKVPIAMHIYVGSKAPWDEIAGDAAQHVEDWPERPL